MQTAMARFRGDLHILVNMSFLDIACHAMQAYFQISGHLAGVDALDFVEVLSLGHDSGVSHHCFSAAGH